jgi:hypothetical protein
MKCAVSALSLFVSSSVATMPQQCTLGGATSHGTDTEHDTFRVQSGLHNAKSVADVDPDKYLPYDVSQRSPEAMDDVTDLHVVFSNHLDIGFNVRAWCDGDGGACTSTANSKNGQPCRPWAYWVLNENIDTFL